MDKTYTIFISHNSEDKELAFCLQDILIELKPELEGKIFLDCSNERPLDKTDEWMPALFNALEHSRYLIFLTRDMERVKKGNGWVYTEVSHFFNLEQSSERYKNGEFNLSHFGIFLCESDFSKLSSGAAPELAGLYSEMYGPKQNLVLGENADLRAAKERILDKLNGMFSIDSSKANDALVLDKTREFAAEKAQSDDMFCPEMIEDALIPYLDTEAGRIDFNSFCENVKKDHISLLGSEGGCGKTTILTKLFYTFLNAPDVLLTDSMIPLYVDAKKLVSPAGNHYILRYLAKVLFDEYTAMTDRTTSANVGLLDFVFSRKTEKPRYLLIIDGYNEILQDNLDDIASELKEYLPGGRYSNVRVVVSGRFFGTEMADGDGAEGLSGDAEGEVVDAVFLEHKVAKLETSQVTTYLKDAGLWMGNVEKSLFAILRIPMYLKMYANTLSAAPVHNKTQLLSAFIYRQGEKDKNSAAGADTKALQQLYLYHLLPLVAARMFSGAQGKTTFFLTKDEMFDVMEEALDTLSSVSYKKYYGEKYVRETNVAKFKTLDAMDLQYSATDYFVRVCKLLREDHDGNLSFVHQIYRDFFFAKHLSETVKRASATKEECLAFSEGAFSAEIVSFVSELLGETAPFVDEESNLWDYSCNESSVLLPLLDAYRGKNDDASKIAVSNVLALLKHIRGGDLSSLDLSCLDLTASSLKGVLFSRFDKNGVYATTFRDSIINCENIITENHFSRLMAACTNEFWVATVDLCGVIKLWKKQRVVNFPLKVICGAPKFIRKLLFSQDNSKIYAMTLHNVYEIDVLESFSYKANPKCIFKTELQLRDIQLDEAGGLVFSTFRNSFNYKRITAPEEGDIYNFYRLNSGAAVLKNGQRMAYGISGGKQLMFGGSVGSITYDGLCVFDLESETNRWKERRFGYYSLIESFVFDLEQCFNSWSLYDLFPTDTKIEGARKTFFANLEKQFFDRTHHHMVVPGLILERCLKTLEKTGKLLSEEQRTALSLLVEKYQNLIFEEYKNNPLLMLLVGRKITGLSAKPDGSHLVVSAMIDYGTKLKRNPKTSSEDAMEEGAGKQITLQKNLRFDTLVLEIDTDTFESRFVTRIIGDNPVYAHCCGEDIVVRTNYHATVYNSQLNDIAHITTLPKTYREMAPSRDGKYFYLVSEHFIYKLTPRLQCVQCLPNPFYISQLSLTFNGKGEEYLLCRKSLDGGNIDISARALDLSNGNVCTVVITPELIANRMPFSQTVNFEDVCIKTRAERLVAYRDSVKFSELEVPYKLCVAGCDFEAIKGELPSSHYFEVLSRMGAQNTDPIDSLQVPVLRAEAFTASAQAYVVPRDTGKSSLLCVEGAVLKDAFLDVTLPGGNNLHSIKMWNRILHAFESVDLLPEGALSLLEWVNILEYVTPDILETLVEAGLVRLPKEFDNVHDFVECVLHQNYVFLFRCNCLNETGHSFLTLYTLNQPFGTSVMEEIVQKAVRNPMLDLRKTAKNRSFRVTSGVKNPFTVPLEINKEALIKEAFDKLILNRWFALTAKRHKDKLEDWAFFKRFVSDAHSDAKGTVHAFARFAKRPFFAEVFHAPKDAKFSVAFLNKIKRLCALSLTHSTLNREDVGALSLEKQPVLVLIGDDFESCKWLYCVIENLYPEVRKLFTYDALLNSAEAFAGAGNYFEFVDRVPRSVRFEDAF